MVAGERLLLAALQLHLFVLRWSPLRQPQLFFVFLRARQHELMLSCAIASGHEALGLCLLARNTNYPPWFQQQKKCCVVVMHTHVFLQPHNNDDQTPISRLELCENGGLTYANCLRVEPDNFSFGDSFSN